MRWRRGAGTDQVEDRRRMGGAPAIGGGMGIVGLLVVLAINLLGGGGGDGSGIGLPSLSPVDAPSGTGGTIPANDEQAQFIAFVIDDVQDAWEQIFTDSGRAYERTRVVLFDGSTGTGCGTGTAAIGPFYCPADSQVYIDLSFFSELSDRFGAPGDFAQAYVIAHEVGHHVQHLLGISEQVSGREDGIKLELQADCFAGVWGHRANAEEVLEAGDLEEGIKAAAAVGDDRLQQQAGREVNSETWTHGSSEQRIEWFRRGFDTGDPERCDTFG